MLSFGAVGWFARLRSLDGALLSGRVSLRGQRLPGDVSSLICFGCEEMSCCRGWLEACGLLRPSSFAFGWKWEEDAAGFLGGREAPNPMFGEDFTACRGALEEQMSPARGAFSKVLRSWRRGQWMRLPDLSCSFWNRCWKSCGWPRYEIGPRKGRRSKPLRA